MHFAVPSPHESLDRVDRICGVCHCLPFGRIASRFLVDRVIERSDSHIVTLKHVSSAEEYLADHFPGFPVLPAVMMLESLVQAARLLIGGGNDPSAVPLVLSEARNVRYGNLVRPGQALRVEVTLRQRAQDDFDFQGVGTVDGAVAVQGRFRLTPLDSVGS